MQILALLLVLWLPDPQLERQKNRKPVVHPQADRIPIFNLPNGREILARSVFKEDFAGHNFGIMESYNIYVFAGTRLVVHDTYLYIPVSAMDMEVLIFVSPKQYQGEMYEVDTMDFLEMMETGMPFGPGVGAEEYTEITDIDPNVLFQQDKIHPQECEQGHPNDSPHTVDGTSPGSSPCHGELGNDGGCSGRSGLVDWRVTCISRLKPDGSTSDWCEAVVSCDDDGYGRVNGGPLTRFMKCNTFVDPVSNMVAGPVSDLASEAKAFIKCGNRLDTFECQ